MRIHPGPAQPLGELGWHLEPRFHKGQKFFFKAQFYLLFFLKAKQKFAYKFKALSMLKKYIIICL
jgi:hypothetical protein